MAKVTFVQAARKDYPEHNIKKGESYFWWQLFKQPKRYSKTRPKQSQLTGSAFLSQYYEFQEELESMTAESIEDVQIQLEDLASRIRELGEEQCNNRDNMPEGLQDSETGQLLEERADGMESWASEIECLDFSFDADEDLTEEENEEALQEKIQELITSASEADPGLS